MLNRSQLFGDHSKGRTYHYVYDDPCIVAYGVVDQLLRLILKLVCLGLRNPGAQAQSPC